MVRAPLGVVVLRVDGLVLGGGLHDLLASTGEARL
jgi:hypothetical protein